MQYYNELDKETQEKIIKLIIDEYEELNEEQQQYLENIIIFDDEKEYGEYIFDEIIEPNYLNNKTIAGMNILNYIDFEKLGRHCIFTEEYIINDKITPENKNGIGIIDYSGIM